MGERLTKHDVEKIEKEIEYRKLVVRKDAIEAVKSINLSFGKIIYQLDTSGENYYLEKGDTTWHPFDGKIASHSLVIPRSEAERLEDNWYLKYGKKERPE